MKGLKLGSVLLDKDLGITELARINNACVGYSMDES